MLVLVARLEVLRLEVIRIVRLVAFTIGLRESAEYIRIADEA